MKHLKGNYAIVSLTLCLLLALSPAMVLAEDVQGNWEALFGQALDSVQQLTAPEGALTVQASASVNIAPDMAQVNLGMNAVHAELSSAQSEANAVVNGVIEAVAALGIERSAIATSNYSISPQYDYTTGDGTQVTGYRVYNTITVRVDDFALLDAVIDEAVKAGANEVYGISFDVNDRAAYYRQALANAVSAAQEKAQLLAEASGVTLEAMQSLREVSTMDNYYAYANAADSVMRTEGSSTSIQGGELSVSAQVELVYGYKVMETAVEPIG